MKILLVHPYATKQDRRSPRSVFSEPLGLLSLATFLEHHCTIQVEIKLLDLYALGWNRFSKKGERFVVGLSTEDEIYEHVRDFWPAVVGITSNFTAYADDALEVAQLFKCFWTNVPVVLGGAHATMAAADILTSFPFVDYVVRGEGELSFCELVEAIGNNDSVDGIKGISYRDKYCEVVTNSERELVSDIDALPIIDRKWIDMERYRVINSRSLPFTKQDPVATIVTSRGCPFNCVFCSTKAMWRRRFRARSAENVFKEIEYLAYVFGIREIAIEDDQFVFDKQRVLMLCDMLIQRDLKVTLSIPSGTSIWLLDAEILKRMKMAGFYRLSLSIESGVQKTMDFIGKPVNLSKVKETIRTAHDLGYWTQGNFIIGFPYETKEEIEQTIRFAYDCGTDYIFIFIAKPYAGAELYHIMKQEGLLNKIVKYSHTEESDYNTKTMTAKELNYIRNRAIRGFWLHKIKFYLKFENMFKDLVPRFQSMGDIRYGLRILGTLFTRIVIPELRAQIVMRKRRG